MAKRSIANISQKEVLVLPIFDNRHKSSSRRSLILVRVWHYWSVYTNALYFIHIRDINYMILLIPGIALC